MDHLYVVKVGRTTRAGALQVLYDFPVRSEASLDDVSRHYRKQYVGLSVGVTEAEPVLLEIPAPAIVSKPERVRICPNVNVELTAEEQEVLKTVEAQEGATKEAKGAFFKGVGARFLAANPWAQEAREPRIEYSGVRFEVVTRWEIIEEVINSGKERE